MHHHLQLLALLLEPVLSILQLLSQQLDSSFPGGCRFLQQGHLQALGVVQGFGLLQICLSSLQAPLKALLALSPAALSCLQLTDFYGLLLNLSLQDVCSGCHTTAVKLGA